MCQACAACTCAGAISIHMLTEQDAVCLDRKNVNLVVWVHEYWN